MCARICTDIGHCQFWGRQVSPNSTMGVYTHTHAYTHTTLINIFLTNSIWFIEFHIFYQEHGYEPTKTVKQNTTQSSEGKALV